MPSNSRLFASLFASFAILIATSAGAQTAGAIVGRVYNPNTGEYVRNAQVAIEETGQTTNSAGGGEYRLSPVAPGRATVVVSYTGYRTVRAVVSVGTGATVTQDFNLVSTLEAETVAPETVKLDAFIVSSEREGSAKAIMDQRNSMNVTNTIASDTFGDNAEGNIGEFLRNVPGVELDLQYGEVRNVRLRGLGSEYTSVTIDGVALASADANLGAAGNARAFTFEMASLNSMESVEVSKTISADDDANAPAGTIKLKTKRAFDRAGRRVSWQVNAVMHSEEFSLRRSPGPDDDRASRKIRPGGIFEYSDLFLNKRLGVVLNLNESNVYQEAMLSAFNFDATPTAADRRPLVITEMRFQHAPRFNRRSSVTLTTDYRATQNLTLGLNLVYNYNYLWTSQRKVTFNTGPRATILGTEPLLSFTSNSAAAYAISESAPVAKVGETFTAVPSFEYKKGDFLLEGKFAWSDSSSQYDPLGREGSIYVANPRATGVNFSATRSSPMAVDWQIAQVSGPDLASGSSFAAAAFTANDGRFSRSRLMSGEIIGTLRATRILPVTWKAGLKDRYEIRKFENDRNMYWYRYSGPGAANGAWSDFRSDYEFDFGYNGGRITTVSGGRIFMPAVKKIGQLFLGHPEYFTNSLTNDYFYNSYVALHRRFGEEIAAGFVMGTATLNRRTTLRAGLRWEDTSTEATEPDARSSAEVRAAGFPVSATTGRATTIDGTIYQFLSRPRRNRTGDYDNLFPSASLKYLLTPNLNFVLGYSSTIRRATYANLAGVWLINDNTSRVTAPNTGLRPETAQNYAARLAYYFEPVGQLAVSFFQNRVKDLHVTQELTAEQFGNTDEALAGYTFVTTSNSDDRMTLRGMELEYSQSLGFLGEKFKRLNVRAAYTRNYAESAMTYLTPHIVGGGINYTLNRLNVFANANWTDNMPVTITSPPQWQRHRLNLDVGGGWRLTKNLNLNMSARNVLNTPLITMVHYAPNAPALARADVFGITYTFAIKGTY